MRSIWWTDPTHCVLLQLAGKRHTFKADHSLNKSKRKKEEVPENKHITIGMTSIFSKYIKRHIYMYISLPGYTSIHIHLPYVPSQAAFRPNGQYTFVYIPLPYVPSQAVFWPNGQYTLVYMPLPCVPSQAVFWPNGRNRAGCVWS